MKKNFRQNRWQLALAAAAVVILLWLFVKAQPVDPDMHNRVASDIAELQKRDTELGEAVLQLHYRLTNNYDGAVSLMQRIEVLGMALEQHHKNGLLPDTPEVRWELTQIGQQIKQKAEKLDEFKSNNAVMKNSLIYLPSMVNSVLAELPRSDENLLEKFEFLLRDALLVSVKGDAASIEILEADIIKVEQAIPGLPVKLQRLARYVVSHAQALLEVDKGMPVLLAELSSYQTSHLGADMDGLYQDYYQERQRTAGIYRLSLLLAAMLMLIYSVNMYYRLKSQRQQLEDALAEISNQQHALNEHAIVSITDVKGNITYVNDKFMEISGYTEEALIGQNHRMIKSDEHGEEFFRELWRTVANGKVWHGQVKNLAKDGHFYWVEATVVPFMNHEGKPYQYVSMRTDITAQKAMEQQVEADRRLLQNVMDTLGEGVYMLDIEGRCTYLNREAEAIIGWTSEELLGRKLHDVIHSQLPDGTPVAEADCPVHQSMLAKKLFRSETDYFQHKNGTLFPIAIVASPMLDGEKTAGSVAAFQDISERKFTERELLRAKESAEAASKAKGDFLATMSHEIRTPMNGIIGMTELALDTELDAEQREYLNLIKSSADSLLTIINDILDFSKIESGKLELEQLDFDVRALFASAEKALVVRAEQKGLELVYDVDSEIPDLLTGDPGRLRQVLTNLLGNAIKFSEQGVVTLRMKLLRQSGSEIRVCIEVADQGIGISSEKQAHIFEAFTQADTSTTRKYGGTGLGLAISSQLVEAMGGQLEVESELGLGSVFSFEINFPVAAVQRAAQPLVGLEGLSALIVDDNATNRHLLMQMLRKWNMKPEVAENAEQAMAMASEAHCRGEPFKLMLLDAMMPDVDGFELAEKLRVSPNISYGAVMMLSSAGMREDAQRCRELSISAYLTKPVEQNELMNAIRMALGVGTDAVPMPGKNSPTLPRRLNILLAEDNLVNQKLAVTLLEKWGHSVELANNGREAVEKNQSQSFDVILMDLQMPEMGGLEATRLVRVYEESEGKHTPIIAMTANAMAEDRQRCLDAGMDDYLTKPLNFDKLQAVLQGLPCGADAESGQPVESAFDYAAALKRADAWVIETIGQAFLDECDQLMTEIRTAMDAADKVSLLRGAHTLRGLVGNFNARGVEEVARQIEELAEHDYPPGGLFARLQVEIGLLKAALATYLGSKIED
ncbi:MAG: response regulator [Gallionella sp.]|nr:response regulator [Gallionella sp.]MDP1941625.1 response regulator [Gallionella sp.]